MTPPREVFVDVKVVTAKALMVVSLAQDADDETVHAIAAAAVRAGDAIGMAQEQVVVLGPGTSMDMLTDADLGNLGLVRRDAAWVQRARALEGVLLHLDRCEHGRHEGDECSGCEGPSAGNPVMRLADRELDSPWERRATLPLRTIGFDTHGNPIVVPDAEHLTDADAWRTR